MKECRKISMNKKLATVNFLLAALFFSVAVYAQDGTAGINDANQKVRSYFAAGTNLMYAIGAIVGLIGAVKVYSYGTVVTMTPGKLRQHGLALVYFLLL